LEGVDEAVVVPVPDEEFGARPVAYVRINDAESRDLARELEPFLPRFKIPVSFHPWPGEARPGMKADRTALGERARRLRGRA
jgi:O-succinylbenzoic acid--CoA ligase